MQSTCTLLVPLSQTTERRVSKIVGLVMDVIVIISAERCMAQMLDTGKFCSFGLLPVSKILTKPHQTWYSTGHSQRWLKWWNYVDATLRVHCT